MPYNNIRTLILVGNVESRLEGPAPAAALDRQLNGWLASTGQDPDEPGRPRVFQAETRRFLTGALPRVKRILRRSGIRFRVRDPRLQPRPLPALGQLGPPRPPLRDYQSAVVEKALARGTGVIDIGTGGGKTRIAAEIIHRLGRPALYIVTTRTLLRQAARHLHQYLGEEPGVIGAGMEAPRPITVGLVQSLVQEQRDVTPWYDGCLIFDEGHHGCAPTYLSLLQRIDARFNFFLSAVPYRSGGDQELLNALTGGSLTGGAYSAAYLIDHGYAAPVRLHVERISIQGNMLEKPFWRLYEEKIVDNAERNARIVALARGELAHGRSTLLLVEQIRHGEILLAEFAAGAAFVHGGTGKIGLQTTTDRFARGDLPLLIATVGLFNEGVSIDGIHCVINAAALKSKVKVLQMIGRGMRLAPGKGHVRYVDFFDDCETGVFRGHSLQRLRTLKSEGFAVPAVAVPARVPMEMEPIEPAWAHVPGTQQFVQVDMSGHVVARGLCLRKAPVPGRFCNRCRTPDRCQKGGIITWRGSDSTP